VYRTNREYGEASEDGIFLTITQIQKEEEGRMPSAKQLIAHLVNKKARLRCRLFDSFLSRAEDVATEDYHNRGDAGKKGI